MVIAVQYITILLSLLLADYTVKNKEYTHPLYVAVAEIDYKSSDKYARLVCKIFSDDLQLALEKQSGKKESIDNAGSIKKLSSEIDAYIKNHLQLKINARAKDFVFTNCEKEDNAILVYYTINNMNEIQRFEVTDTIFYELYDNQIQMVYITVNGNRKSNRITNPQSKVAFDF